jgi:hypothetical protein
MNQKTDRVRGVVDILKDGRDKPPPVLYKYYSLDEYTERVFKNNEVYFQSPELFDDPFDSKIEFYYQGPRAERKRLLYEASKQYRPDLPRRFHLAVAKKARKTEWDRSEMPAGIQELFRDVRRRIGVFCLSAKDRDILMWSHYASKHAGFCLEFRTDNAFFARAQRVAYGKDRPRLNLLEPWESLITKGAYGLLTKSTAWTYEEEWRIIEMDRVKNMVGIQRYPPEALSAVIVGCKMSLTDRRRIAEWCCARDPRPALYEAKEKEGEFALDIVPIVHKRNSK